MKIEKILLFIAFAALAAGVVMLVMGVLKKDYEPNQYKDAFVIVALRDIPEGHVLVFEDLTYIKVPLSEPGAVLYADGKIEKMIGNYVTKIPIPRRNQIIESMLTEKSGGGGSALVRMETRGYVAPAGITVDGAARLKDFSVGGRSYTLWSVTPEAAQGMLLKEVSAGGDR